jgi:hypothetical protein
LLYILKYDSWDCSTHKSDLLPENEGNILPRIITRFKRCKMPEHNSDPQIFASCQIFVFKHTDTCCTGFLMLMVHSLILSVANAVCCVVSVLLQIKLCVERSVLHVLECAQKFPKIAKSIFFCTFIILYL